MSNYSYKIPKTGRVAQGTKNQYMAIYQRSIAGTNPNNKDASETFTLLYPLMGRVEQLRTAERFNGVGTKKELVTAAIYLSYDPAIYQLDKESCFINVEYNYYTGDSNRWYKLIEIENMTEDNRELKIYCAETGFTTHIASGV